MDPSGVDLADLYIECVQSAGIGPACEKFFEILRPTLRRVAYRVAAQFGAKQDTDDVVQEISLKLAAKDSSGLAGIPKEQPASIAYFSVIAANAARDYFRSRNAVKRGFSRTVPIEESLNQITGNIPAGLDREMLISQIASCVPADPKSRIVFGLYFRQGFSAKELAAIPALELTVKGVESLIRRTILHIREQLGAVRAKDAREGGDAA